MRIIRAAHLGWCFGVRDAVTLATRAARGNSVTVLGELVHNQQVNDLLRAQGVRLTRRVEEVTTATVIITAHGASEKALERVRARAPNVIEATCPLVRAAHDAVRDLVAAGFHPVIIGQRDHVEVRGLTEDLAAYDVVLTEADVAALPGRRRFGVAAQTTQPVDRVRGLVGSIQHRFPVAELRFVDTVCRPTKDRQAAAAVLARQCDVVVVIGGRHSSNTVELARTCARSCARVVRGETVADLRSEWFTDADTVGITAGTSTPDVVIDEVEQWLQELAAGQEVSRPAPDLEPHIA
ncbi:4-hydroxy-3-methylbut-2-enyl diphosphate reductase [bacterium]|nr:4-hydroxy-3-methylbut-2-enyl diphosphate reductase [bacterium]